MRMIITYQYIFVAVTLCDYSSNDNNNIIIKRSFLIFNLDDIEGKKTIMDKAWRPIINAAAGIFSTSVNSIDTIIGAETLILPPNRAITDDDSQRPTPFADGTTANKVCDGWVS